MVAKKAARRKPAAPRKKAATKRSTSAPRVNESIRGYYTQTGYQAARVARRQGQTAMAMGGERHTQYDRLTLISESRNMLRDNPIYSGMIDRAIGYIVGNGFTLNLRTADETRNSRLEHAWAQWYRKPEVTQLLSGVQASRMIMRELLVCGDTGALKTNKQLIQLFEAEQISGNTLLDNGMETDDLGRPTAFLVRGYDKNGQLTKKPRSVSPGDFLFLCDPQRPSQRRGVPPCQSAFPMLHRINDVCDSEAIAWQMLSRLAISITRAQGESQAYAESIAGQAGDTGSMADRITELDYALIFHGNHGDEIRGIERNIPGRNFSDSVLMFLRLMGLPLGLPLEIILLDWTKSNYSQSRAVLEQAHQTFMRWQQIIEDGFYRPVIEWLMELWGEPIDDPQTEIELIKPTFPWIDLLKEVQALGESIDRTLTTHDAVCKQRGSERIAIVKEREQEVRDAIGRSQKIEAETGVAVPWQTFAGIKVPSGAPASAPAPSGEKDDDDE